MTNAEIQVGEYVRTKTGRISKIIEKCPVYENGKLIYYQYKTTITPFYFNDYEIKDRGWKIEKNIIDLIEAGDYVNGLKVYNVEKAKNIVTEKDCLAINMQNLGAFILYEKSIKSIVTKEQFKNMEYKVGGEDDR